MVAQFALQHLHCSASRYGLENNRDVAIGGDIENRAQPVKVNVHSRQAAQGESPTQPASALDVVPMLFPLPGEFSNHLPQTLSENWSRGYARRVEAGCNTGGVPMPPKFADDNLVLPARVIRELVAYPCGDCGV